MSQLITNFQPSSFIQGSPNQKWDQIERKSAGIEVSYSIKRYLQSSYTIEPVIYNIQEWFFISSLKQILRANSDKTQPAQANQKTLYLSDEIRKGPKKHDNKQETNPNGVVPLLQLPRLVFRWNRLDSCL
jgi:hypothetical protein